MDAEDAAAAHDLAVAAALEAVVEQQLGEDLANRATVDNFYTSAPPIFSQKCKCLIFFNKILIF